MDAEWDPPFEGLNGPKTVQDVLQAMLYKSLALGLQRVAATGGFHFSIGTLCSGTDAPILALREFQEAAAALGFGGLISFRHAFSAEIEAFKQAFIRRNAAPDGPIFRDVLEVARGTRACVARVLLRN